MHKSKLKRISLAVCFVFLPLVADAAGLGRLTVISGLGEPLNAEIELLATNSEELSTLTAAIAPDEAYAIQGIERTALHNAINVAIDKKANGSPIIRLTTRQPVNDPFLDMLIQVDWATGRLLREYTALLDPPGYASPAPATPPTVAPAAKAQPSAQDSLPAPATENMRQQGSPPAAVADTHETVRGDTLTAIAQKLQPADVSLEQMLVGLYRENKQAFAGDNMNRLKVGQIIRVPDRASLQAIGRNEAQQEIRMHTADWEAYRNRLAGIVEASDPSEDVANQAGSGKLKAAADDRAAAGDNVPRDVVKLSKSDSSSTTGNDQKVLQERLNALQEEVAARENSIKEANERTAALEKQIQDMQQLLAIKNQAMADLQNNAATPGTETTAQANVPAAADAPAASTDSTTAESKAEPAVPAPTGAVTKAETPAKPAAPLAAQPSGSLLDDLMQNSFFLPGLAAVLALLIGAWALVRNKRRRDLDNFEKGILTSGGLKANTVFGNTAGATVDTGDTSFLTDFSQSAGGMIDTHDVDPIAEAEVYMAYGRDAQAEEILKDAIKKEPRRYELHLKLLEIFAGRNDSSSFETIAGELYSTLGANDPIWKKVAEIGNKMEPDNPLYQASATAAHTSPDAEAATRKLESADFAEAELMSDVNLDFSQPDQSRASGQQNALPDQQPQPHMQDHNRPLDFDFNTVQPASIDEAVTIAEPPADSTVGDSLDFPEEIAANTVQLDINDFAQTKATMDFELPELNVAEAEAKASADATAPQLPETGFDLPEMASEPAGSLDFPSLDHQQDKTAAPAEEIVFEAQPDDGSLDFNFDDARSEPEAPATRSISNTSDTELSDIRLDFGSDDTHAARDLHDESAEVNTKIDLITAYLDMDDVEGARELLDEVLQEGGPKQQERARKLLERLA